MAFIAVSRIPTKSLPQHQKEAAMSSAHALSIDSGLALDGTCAFSVSGGRVLLSIDAIRNQRDIGNLSGTLAVELWALNLPLNGPEPETEAGAQCLAATTIGEIRGQHFVPDCRYDLLFTQPVAGTWQIALLLREWNGHGYSTRDVVNFPVPYLVKVPPESVANAPISGSVASSSPAPEGMTADPAPEIMPAHVPVEPSVVPSPAKAEKSAASKAKKGGKFAANSAGDSTAVVALNTATVEEIANIKGVSPKLAKALVAGRPYRDFKELLEVKGVGEKLLRILRPLVHLD